MKNSEYMRMQIASLRTDMRTLMRSDDNDISAVARVEIREHMAAIDRILINIIVEETN